MLQLLRWGIINSNLPSPNHKPTNTFLGDFWSEDILGILYRILVYSFHIFHTRSPGDHVTCRCWYRGCLFWRFAVMSIGTQTSLTISATLTILLTLVWWYIAYKTISPCVSVALATLWWHHSKLHNIPQISFEIYKPLPCPSSQYILSRSSNLFLPHGQICLRRLLLRPPTTPCIIQTKDGT